MKILLAILSCQGYAERRGAQRDTWLKDLHGADYRFFVGRPSTRDWEHVIAPDVVLLNCCDDYSGLSEKVRKIVAWAYIHRYDFLFKADDDTYIWPERLLESGFEAHSYSGFIEDRDAHLRAFNFPVYPHARGGSGYWIDRKAMGAVLNELPDKRHQEDFAVGEAVAKRGLSTFHDDRYSDIQDRATHVAPISLHSCGIRRMREIHAQVTSSSAIGVD